MRRSSLRKINLPSSVIVAMCAFGVSSSSTRYFTAAADADDVEFSDQHREQPEQLLCLHNMLISVHAYVSLFLCACYSGPDSGVLET